ncbi:MAG: DUF2341 domain-containing protein [Planctomycetota bacterium]
MKNNPNNSFNKGSTLLIALLITSFALLIGVTLLETAYQSNRLTGSSGNSSEAFSLAESGLIRARWRLGLEADWSAIPPTNLYTDIALGQGTYSVVLSERSANAITVISTGKSGLNTRKLKGRIERNNDWLGIAWLYCKPITITNTTASTLIDYPVRMTVTFVPGKMNANFSDIRFGSSEEVQPFWVESYTASISADVWVNVDSIPASGSATIYIYYGNPAASSASDGPSTFDLFDHFDDGVVDATIWTTQRGSLVESGTEIAIMRSGVNGILGSGNTFGVNYAIRYRGLHRNTTTNVAGFITGTGSERAVVERATAWRVRSRISANTVTALAAGLLGSYQIYEIRRDNGTANVFFVNDAQVASHATQVSAASLPVTASNTNSTAGGILNLDWILARKYINPEPGYAFGTESPVKRTKLVYWRELR